MLFLEQEGHIRLMYGGSANIGSLQYFHNGQWGAICDSELSTTAADVACKQLGYVGLKAYYCCSQFSVNAGQFWLSGINCTGTETNINQCKIKFYNATCRFNNVAGIQCQGIVVFELRKCYKLLIFPFITDCIFYNLCLPAQEVICSFIFPRLYTTLM